MEKKADEEEVHRKELAVTYYLEGALSQPKISQNNKNILPGQAAY